MEKLESHTSKEAAWRSRLHGRRKAARPSLPTAGMNRCRRPASIYGGPSWLPPVGTRPSPRSQQHLLTSAPSRVRPRSRPWPVRLHRRRMPPTTRDRADDCSQKVAHSKANFRWPIQMTRTEGMMPPILNMQGVPWRRWTRWLRGLVSLFSRESAYRNLVKNSADYRLRNSESVHVASGIRCPSQGGQSRRLINNCTRCRISSRSVHQDLLPPCKAQILCAVAIIYRQ